MRTNNDIDDALLAEASASPVSRSKRSTVEYALRELVRRKDRQAILRLHGQVEWTGDLKESRQSRTA